MKILETIAFAAIIGVTNLMCGCMTTPPAPPKSTNPTLPQIEPVKTPIQPAPSAGMYSYGSWQVLCNYDHARGEKSRAVFPKVDAKSYPMLNFVRSTYGIVKLFTLTNNQPGTDLAIRIDNQPPMIGEHIVMEREIMNGQTFYWSGMRWPMKPVSGSASLSGFSDAFDHAERFMH